MAFRLPPLSSLRVFEAAARHHSFRKAADELNLTASAVSHAIQTLENWLGVELFAREARGLRLTSAGEAYAPLVNQALALLASATDKVPGRRPTGTLALSSAPSFASKMLVPRLERFTAQHPDIHLTIDTSTRIVDLGLDDFDVAIRYLSIRKPAANWTMLVPETIVPVCSPSIKQRFADATLIDFLSRTTLIHVTTVSADWKHWFRANGFELPPSIDDGMHIDTIHTAFDAAIRGLGIVLGRRPLVDDDLESGRLVALTSQTIPSGSAFWLVTPQTEFEKPEIKQFRQWLLSELGVGSQTRSQLGSPGDH
jgi:LysR family transcriptional regulator, glycine cleavage system transcriptional activator